MIGQSLVDLVAEDLLESAHGECFASQLPVGLRLVGSGQDPQPFLAHELVVQLSQTMPPRGIPLKRLAGEVVVVDHEHVGVPVPSCRVRVHDYEVVGAVHPFDESSRHVADAIEVRLRCDIELIRMERQHVTVEHDLATSSTGKLLRPLDECRRRGLIAGH